MLMSKLLTSPKKRKKCLLSAYRKEEYQQQMLQGGVAFDHNHLKVDLELEAPPS